jgi:hypothetical protein
MTYDRVAGTAKKIGDQVEEGFRRETGDMKTQVEEARKELRNGSSKSEHEPTPTRSTSYGSGQLIRVFRVRKPSRLPLRPEGSGWETRKARHRFLRRARSKFQCLIWRLRFGQGSMLCAPIPHSLRSDCLIRTHDAINGMTLE